MIDSKLHGDVLALGMANPPVNALGIGLRQALTQAIEQAQANPAVKAIVVYGSGRLFSAGADITEFGRAPVDPWLPAVVDTLESSAKPVVAAIHGSALGGGLEVALGCHYRVAVPGAKLGLPEVTLGILPGAGGTQRLPRLVGAEKALTMITSGVPINGDQALKLGLVDKLAGNDSLVADAIAYARGLTTVRRTRDLKVARNAEVFDRFLSENSRKLQGLDAPAACVEAVRAATELPFEEGMNKERALFAKLVVGGQSAALRHAFFAERTAAKIEGLPKDAQPRAIRKVGVVGAGTMGGGISMNFLSAGIPVTIVELAQEALDRGVGTVRKNYEASAAKGKLTPQQVEAAIGLLTPTLDFNALSSCDLIIEAVYENMDVKKQIFARLDGIAKQGAVLASNTSYLDINEIGAMTQRPQDVLGLHFFSPANVMKLVEVVRGAKTAHEVLATGMDIARKIGKVPVVAGVCHGFIGNRMLAPRQANALELLLEGATPAQIDKVHTAFGMPMGPFQMADLAGVDIGWHRDPNKIETVREALCARGRWGQKTKAGFYDYDDKRKASPSPVVEEILTEFRQNAALTPRPIADEEILVRTLYTLVNEGAKILEEGIAQRASDIDVVWLYGYGWPRHTGGPMFWAEATGLKAIVAGLRKYQDKLGAGFTISPLLIERANGSGKFSQ
jgi:3-hydroxyacyl-CoA dehydrogenase